jgi:hypothetical protein
MKCGMGIMSLETTPSLNFNSLQLVITTLWTQTSEVEVTLAPLNLGS